MVKIRQTVTLRVGKAQVSAEISSFHGLCSGSEHIAMQFPGSDKSDQLPLVRMHSECLTGDVFHSSRCDCGEQLNEAINLLHESGGILLYLRQEGRGIGLYNKLDAYALQDTGLNTYEANEQLGFDRDLRDFGEAAEMLKAMGHQRIHLLTNNPRKVRLLTEAGIEVESTHNTSVHMKPDNASYLKAKQQHGKHELLIE